MRYIQVKKAHAQKAKEALLAAKALGSKHRIVADGETVAFPLAADGQDAVKLLKAKQIPGKQVERDAAERKRDEGLAERLDRILSPEEREMVVTAFDTVGDIAILDIPDELQKKEKHIAEAVLASHKNLKVVLRKAGIHGGEFRTQQMAHLAGEERKETIHKESGCRISLDVEKVYFSPRLGNERLRVSQQVKKGEDILVLFSGCAPYVCVIAKNSGPHRIVGIEKNPVGHSYGLKNLSLNKIRNAELFLGDVKEVAPKIKERFDRIVMPLPKSAGDFLHEALSLAKQKAVLHFYDFKDEKGILESEQLIKRACAAEGWKCSILRTVICGDYSPRVHRICVDALIEKKK